jgi:Raf kinase inhibitor-like YbhB/YbcL family protein
MSNVKMPVRRLSIATTIACVVSVFAGCGEARAPVAKKTSKAATGSVVTLNVVSSAFRQDETIPKAYTFEGSDISPGLAWSPTPAATKAIAIYCEDPDAPNGTWCHWIAFNIPPKSRFISQGVRQIVRLPDGATQATNDFQKIGYNGPKPPKGETHRYYYHVYALSRPLMLTYSAMKNDFLKAIAGNILANGYIMGKYTR